VLPADPRLHNHHKECLTITTNNASQTSRCGKQHTCQHQKTTYQRASEKGVGMPIRPQPTPRPTGTPHTTFKINLEIACKLRMCQQQSHQRASEEGVGMPVRRQPTPRPTGTPPTTFKVNLEIACRLRMCQQQSHQQASEKEQGCTCAASRPLPTKHHIVVTTKGLQPPKNASTHQRASEEGVGMPLRCQPPCASHAVDVRLQVAGEVVLHDVRQPPDVQPS
jgi:hypothetical protein